MKFVWEDAENAFTNQYILNDEQFMPFFDYSLKEDALLKRYHEIQSRSYQRRNIVEVLTQYNKQFSEDEAIYASIEKLKDDRSVTVVGGQQAGLLTGPIYTINKIISILKTARRVENEHGIPVVPIFWMAGEDHDIDEVNHTFIHNQENIKKLNISERNDLKTPVSERFISADDGKKVVDELFQFLNETEHTRELYHQLTNDVKDGLTYVEWCARILHRLFEGTGLVLMDAACPQIRQIEQPFFKELIKKNDELRGAFIEGANNFKRKNFGEPIAIEESNAHLFVHYQGQRFLLSKNNGVFTDKNRSKTWTEDELLEMVDKDPSCISNNVVTRPLMQDFLLPVLSFVAGPGEIKYWATLKEAFHTFNINMPIVEPRLHITFVSRPVEKNLIKVGVNHKAVALNGLSNKKQQWLKSKEKAPYKTEIENARMQMDEIFSHLSSTFKEYGKEYELLREKYRNKAEDQFVELEKKFEAKLLQENEAGIRRFDLVESEIKPNGNPQERYLNIHSFLNLYGPDLIQRVVSEIPSEDNYAGTHAFIYL
ncbi:bacillithiol biosynthesis cysteine-adding enzyme BshC [Bacillus shivajii]|uniref:bacillithiol biosynthesis cysteine-adding enzyme BshC n=1 Tax=Bacillus shivajii TaxID=1983719 RepID=UPI001CF9C5EB|nr:bacillithiol biosynthesis cysteine-adding enzyme BshC [Bacillus shivajii]UCZ51835.1 bacillithiol biosynthesis cysteine-adding enzyme BshC [Bacillus shivajii]